MIRSSHCLSFVLFVFFVFNPSARAELRAGAFAQDITPAQFPVIINGGFTEVIAQKITDPLHARAVVLTDGNEKIAIVVVDSCMLPRELLDDAKARANKRTGIAIDKMLISATHTHTAPSSMGCLGSAADANYIKILPDLLADAIDQANKRLAPAKIGWTVINDPDHTACRRWIFRPDRMRNDPFGELTVRATMHPGYQSPDAIGPTGPIDPGLSVVSIQHSDGRPLALLANYSMHYVGSTPVSADYYGRFCDAIAKKLGADDSFVSIMSQGTSGDMWLADYSKTKPEKPAEMNSFAEALADEVAAAYKNIRYSDPPIAMRQTTIKLNRRAPDEKRLAWAKEMVAALNGTKPKLQPDIYAREAIFLHDEPVRELKLQAIRIGDLGIAAIPCEVYALSGLKIKAQSPLPTTFNMSLANGSEGYIPPPEQHLLGGYTTWPARTAALEPQAESKIVEASLKLLEDVTGQKRRTIEQPAGAYPQSILASNPLAYFQMREMSPAVAIDSSENHVSGVYEPGVVFYLPGPDSIGFTGDEAANSRAVHFAGGRLKAQPKDLGQNYTVEFWFWNALAADARVITAYLFSRGPDGDKTAPGDHLGIGGTYEDGVAQGKLFFFNGYKKHQLLIGKTALSPRTWYHVAMTCDGQNVTAYLNGQLEISGQADVTRTGNESFFGGRCDKFATLEGKLCQAAIYNRVLPADEFYRHFKVSGMSPLLAAVAAPTNPAAPKYQRASEPRSPEDSMKTIHVAPDMTIELVASEPLIASPVAIDWGADGKLWVVEFADYPYGMDGKGKPGGRIKFLESTKNDGHYDKATLFMDNIRMPNGIIAWKKGVIVTAAPEVFYAEDTDGDGKADKRETLFKGFNPGNPQLRINALRWGLDNWLYLANGLSNGTVESIKTGQKLDIKNHDLRIRPDTGEMELVSGPSQFGRDHDNFGNWFGTENAHPLFHFWLDDRYLKRNANVTFPDVKNQLLPLPLPPVFPRSPFAKRYIGLEHHGHFTSACGISIYRDDLLFSSNNGKRLNEDTTTVHAFICEPVHNLVQHQMLTPDGSTFKAKRIDGESGADFVSAEDNWFRPVMTRSGPDGAIWVVDMYRYMIEHPDWLNETGKKELAPFYRDGDDRGRIYRVYLKNNKPREIARMDQLSTAQLVFALESQSGFTRDFAQRLLLWKNDPAAVPLLEKTATTSQNPLARLHALCMLAGDSTASHLKAQILIAALSDAHPAVRAQAIRLAEPLLDSSPEVLDAVCRIAKDTNAPVCLQLAYTLGQTDQPKAIEAFKLLALNAPADDSVIQALVSSSTGPRLKVMVDFFASGMPRDSVYFNPILEIAMASADRAALGKLLPKLTPAQAAQPTAVDLADFAYLLDRLSAHRTTLEKICQPDDDLSANLRSQAALFDAARKFAGDASQSLAHRKASINLLCRQSGAYSDDLKIVATLFSAQTPADLQLAAIRAAARTNQDNLSAILLTDWPSHSPAVRSAIADALMSRDQWTLPLAQSPAAKDLDFSRKQRLLNHRVPEIKSAAKATLDAAAVNVDRQKVIDSYKDVLTLPGDSKRGQALFGEHCATCHRIGTGAVGHDLGPNLLTVRDWTKENLITAILDPDRTVDPRYISYTVTLADNTALTGLLISESAGNITLKTLDDIEHAIPRGNLKSLTSTNHSLMPQGFESALPPQAIADLIAFIESPSPGR